MTIGDKSTLQWSPSGLPLLLVGWFECVKKAESVPIGLVLITVVIDGS